MNRIAGRSKIALLLAGVLLLGLVVFLGEYVVQADEWVIFSGSPHVYRGSNLNCGIVTDRNGEILLDSTGGRTYSVDPTLRQSTIHLLGDRDGYISAPALAGYSSEMVGFDLLNGIYSTSGTGGTAVLTISAEAQIAAQEALDGRKGVVAVYNYKTGEILCAVSSPNYDPDDVPDLENDDSGRYDGVYVNRFTQSTYTPGSIFKLATTAAALEEIPDIQTRTFLCEGSYWVEGDEVICTGTHGEVNLRQALMHSCNCAFAQIALTLGADTLMRYVEKFQITSPVVFDGVTTAEGNFDLTDAANVNVAWAGIGQYTDQINPCRYMTFMGQIAGGGVAAQPYLVESVSSGMLSSYSAKTTMTGRVMSTAAAAALQDMMHYTVVNNYGESNFPDLYVCAKSGTAEQGGGETADATFAGFTLDEDYPLAFIAIVENGGSGTRTCTPIVSQVLSACMESMDKG